jgi:hypothetical protein
VTLAEFERNLRCTLTLAVMAGQEDPDRNEELGGNAVMLLRELQDQGGLEALVRRGAKADGTG